MVFSTKKGGISMAPTAELSVRAQKRQRKRKRRRRIRRGVLLIIILVVVLALHPLSRWKNILSSRADGISFAAKGLLEGNDDIPAELLELAEKNPETADFVSQYPELHDQHQAIDLSAEAQEDSVPMLLQWDTRWGYEHYGSGMIAYTGCGPTCLSMVALYLTGDTTATPLAVAQYAENQGYYVSGQGTAWTLMSEGSTAFGVTAEELPLDETRIRQALDAGEPVICSMGPGDFTDSGHYIVLTGCTEEGFSVNDPNSISRSEEIWSYETLKGQIRNLWAFCAS